MACTSKDIVNIVNEFNTFIDEIGYDAKVTVGLNLDADETVGEFVVGALWPKGTIEAKLPAVRASGKNFAEVLQSLKDGWEEAKDQYRKQRVRTMAMLIINITDALGCCSTADLIKTGQFNEHDIRTYKEEAIADANRIVTTGPFTISTE